MLLKIKSQAYKLGLHHMENQNEFYQLRGTDAWGTDERSPPHPEQSRIDIATSITKHGRHASNDSCSQTGQEEAKSRHTWFASFDLHVESPLLRFLVKIP